MVVDGAACPGVGQESQPPKPERDRFKSRRKPKRRRERRPRGWRRSQPGSFGTQAELLVQALPNLLTANSRNRGMSRQLVEWDVEFQNAHFVEERTQPVQHQVRSGWHPEGAATDLTAHSPWGRFLITGTDYALRRTLLPVAPVAGARVLLIKSQDQALFSRSCAF